MLSLEANSVSLVLCSMYVIVAKHVRINNAWRLTTDNKTLTHYTSYQIKQVLKCMRQMFGVVPSCPNLQQHHVKHAGALTQLSAIFANRVGLYSNNFGDCRVEGSACPKILRTLGIRDFMAFGFQSFNAQVVSSQSPQQDSIAKLLGLCM